MQPSALLLEDPRRRSVRGGFSPHPSRSAPSGIQIRSANGTVDLGWFNWESGASSPKQSHQLLIADRRESDPLLPIPRDGLKAESRSIKVSNRSRKTTGRPTLDHKMRTESRNHVCFYQMTKKTTGLR